MILYELVTGLRHHTCKEGYIWCKDGSFISPSKFKSSGKRAYDSYGYALGDSKVVSIRRSSSKYGWSGSNSPFYQCVRLAGSLTNGVSNSNSLKSIPGYSSINCPAIYRCLNYTNAGINSYMPAISELSQLYDSIMSGKMKEDLITAGLYEMCNYREATSSSWGYIWSSTQYPSDTYYYHAWSVHHDECVYDLRKDYNTGYVIPFFKFL